MEDEWLVVWLLLTLTASLPGCTARCWDDDGEFLLIEVMRGGGAVEVGEEGLRGGHIETRESHTCHHASNCCVGGP